MKHLSLHKSFTNDGVFELNLNTITSLKTQTNERIYLSLPIDGIEKQVEIYRTNIGSDDFKVVNELGQILSYDSGIHYGGRVIGSEKSFVALSFSDDGIIGIVQDNTKEYGFTKIDENFHRLHETISDNKGFECGCELLPQNNNLPELKLSPKTLTLSYASKCINIRWEADYDVIQQFGGTGPAITWLTALFNAQKQLYANDNIQVNLALLFLWENGPSGLILGTTSDILYAYRDYRNANGGISENCGMLLSFGTSPTSNSGAGVAFVGALCGPNKYGYTQLKRGDSTGTPSSTVYSRSVKVVTHEQGHLLGSRHTFNCGWNTAWVYGDTTFGTERIDGTGGPTYNADEGSCYIPPILPGFEATIMSYGDSQGTAPVNFALGFGPIPRQRIYDFINNNFTCLTCQPLPFETPTPTPTTITQTPTPTPTKTPTQTPTITPTKTNTPTVTLTKTITSTPTKTINATPNPTPTPTITKTITNTNTQTTTITPTNCCSRFTLTSGVNDTGGSIFNVISCNGIPQTTTVPQGTSIDINCASIITLTSGTGTLVRYPGCVCTTPTPTPTVTPSNNSNLTCSEPTSVPFGNGASWTLNGITLTQQWNQNVTIVDVTTTSNYCQSNPTYLFPGTAALLGWNSNINVSGPFIYHIDFSVPVNNVEILYGGAGNNGRTGLTETFIFTTNTGTPTIVPTYTCLTTINGNTLTAGLGSTWDSPNLNTGSGKIKINNSQNYTRLTIEGNGGSVFYDSAGTLFKFCVQESFPNTPTPTPTPTSTPQRGDCAYCISIYPCSVSRYFTSCCEPFETIRIFLIPASVADTLIDGQSYYVESEGFSNCAIYNENLNTAQNSYKYISITPN